jgi:hypothetical protein
MQFVTVLLVILIERESYYRPSTRKAMLFAGQEMRMKLAR